ncbi:MAG: gliding motility protein GldL [Flavobacteriales bacterium]|jgi:gliding motility-associated protein GldL|nr:gliding motility protein GldL [Flavobacteriales bacterium]NCG30671.1 gliding motility protein GldL [Bacteroidota bacterium]MBT3964197.1 gliding motility protein GldL [Flavobacteriales bacterium]MBT4704830.1 gliding motility protein GldL [Flavobacteriales bacterium]MBT4929605.1 gliding motility protein GldL [Flavobacteriales bacterium]
MSQEIKGFRPGSTGWKKFMAKLYGMGAAVVILGALFKIQHWPGAGVMLTVGLTTEAIIFAFSSFEPLHDEPAWELVYPELAAHAEEEEDEVMDEIAEASSVDSDLPVTEQLDNMLEEAKIGPELIDSLGSGLRSLSDNANKLSDMSDASAATNEYVSSVRGAASQVTQLSETYSKASESLASISMTSEDGAHYADSLKSVSSKLQELSSVYDMQLQGSREQMESTKQVYAGIHELMANLQASAEDTKNYKENISELSNNLSALNRVYGNMLAAMNAGGGGNNA